MTKREKQKVRWCIDELMKDEGDFTRVIVELGSLCGVRYPVGELLMSGGVKTTTIANLCKEQSVFKVDGMEVD